MRVIDLLNKIANGEEVPKKIKFDNTYWNRICGEKYPYYTNDYDNDLFIYFFRKNLTFSLNDEVEIIEESQEHKIPEKLNYPHIEIESSADDEIRDYLYKVKDKIDEILDYLEEKE